MFESVLSEELSNRIGLITGIDGLRKNKSNVRVHHSRENSAPVVPMEKLDLESTSTRSHSNNNWPNFDNFKPTATVSPSKRKLQLHRGRGQERGEGAGSAKGSGGMEQSISTSRSKSQPPNGVNNNRSSPSSNRSSPIMIANSPSQIQSTSYKECHQLI